MRKTWITTKKITEEEDQPYSDDFKKELDDLYKEYTNGGDFLTEKEMNKRIENIIKSKIKGAQNS